MTLLIFLGAVITILIGLVAKFVTDRRGDERYKITKREFLVASIVMLLIFVPLTAYIGVQQAIKNQVTFNENWNGWELEAQLEKVPCYEDGAMKHYWVETRRELVTVTETEYYTDSDGKRKSRTVTKQEWKNVDHNIPYTTEEWTFTVRTTIGSKQIAYRFLPENPNNYRYRFLTRVPEERFRSTTGYPEFWLQVRDRIRRNEPGPVTFRMPYDNYILASQSSILKRFNDSIERYTTNGQLPDINSRVHSYYHSDRVYFVGARPPGDWQGALQRFNAALGQTLEGDLHLVIVDANKITDKDNYTGALFAYWQSPKFGKNALSKNGIVLVLGTTDGATIDWAIGSTGMPLGNEALLQEMRYELKGKPLEPEALLGSPQARITGSSVKVTNTSGELEKLVWGPNKFKRVHMNSGEGDVGYEYLLRELKPTTGQLVVILLVISLLALIAWGICIAFGPETYREIRRRFSRNRYRRNF